MTLTDRLAAGADAVWSAGLNPSLADARRDFEVALRAAFPGLFDGTEWVAPWESTNEMDSAGRDGVDNYELRLTRREAEQIFAAMRDAHLKSTINPSI